MKDIKIFIGLFFAIMLSASTINAMSASAGSTVTPGAAALRQRLIEAAKIDALGTVRLLLENGAGDRINATDRYHGMTALMHACRCIDSNSLAIVNLLLEKGADVNAADDYGRTALMFVGDVENIALVELLEGAARYKKKCSWLAGVSHAVRRLAK